MSSSGKKLPVNHFGHRRHPLTLSNKHGMWSRPVCDACLQEVDWQPAYSCKECFYLLHKTCFELPTKIINFMHPKPEHPLELFCQRNGSDKHGLCDHCKEQNWGFSYRCLPCNYELHVNCAKIQGYIDYDGHQHSFILVSRPIRFTCDICGETGEDKCKICYRCQLRGHENCIPSTSMSKTPSSSVSCVPSTSAVPSSDDMNCPADEIIKHFSHNDDHSLIFSNDDLAGDESCGMCNRPLSVPQYSCMDCKFFLHVKCAKMTSKLRSPLHPDTMKFLATTDIERSFGTFSCYLCRRRSNGVAYHCKSNGVILDVNCASIPGTLEHESHSQHTLKLCIKQSSFTCNGCGIFWGEDIFSVVPKFSCEICHYNLDLRCAMLPVTCKHRSHEHILKLNFTGSENAYCVQCEEKCDADQWFYDCKEDIHFSDAHVECLFGIDSNIRFGAPYIHGDHPDHVMSFVEKSRHSYKCGTSCQRDRKDLFVLECRSCNYHFHVKYIADDATRVLQLEKTEDVLLDESSDEE